MSKAYLHVCVFAARIQGDRLSRYSHIPTRARCAPSDGLLLCLTAPQVNLTHASVTVDRIKEGGTLYDTEGKVVYPAAGSSAFLKPLTSEASGDRYLEAIEYGVLADFLGNDEYYASTFEYQRYDQFRTWEYTAKIAKGLIRDNAGGGGGGGGGTANCMLLSSKAWKQRTRYELSLGFSGPGNVDVSQVLEALSVSLAALNYTLNPKLD